MQNLLDITFIQDSFVLNELSSIDCSSMNSKTRANIRIIKKDLNTRIANYHEFQHMHSTKKVIKIKSDNTKKEER